MKHHRRLLFITILVMSSHLSCATSAAHSKNRAPSSLSAWVPTVKTGHQAASLPG